MKGFYPLVPAPVCSQVRTGDESGTRRVPGQESGASCEGISESTEKILSMPVSVIFITGAAVLFLMPARQADQYLQTVSLRFPASGGREPV